MTNDGDDTLPTRQSLLGRMKNLDDQQSWKEFFDTYWRLIYGVAIQAGLSDAEAQEVVQETIVSVARKMRDFKYDPQIGSFKSWLMLLTRRRIIDQFRKRPRECGFPGPAPGETSQTAPVARVADPATLPVEKVWQGEWQKNLLQSAMERTKRHCSPRQFQLFELYVIKEWPVERITQTLGVSAGQVYLAKLRIGNLIKKELKTLQSRML